LPDNVISGFLMGHNPFQILSSNLPGSFIRRFGSCRQASRKVGQGLFEGIGFGLGVGDAKMA